MTGSFNIKQKLESKVIEAKLNPVCDNDRVIASQYLSLSTSVFYNVQSKNWARWSNLNFMTH